MELKPRPITTLMWVHTVSRCSFYGLGTDSVAIDSSDQKLQDIVDRIFPEFKEQEMEMEKQFYEQHGFKKKPEVALTAMPVSADTARANASTGGPKKPSRSTMIEVCPLSGAIPETPLPELLHPFLHVDESYKVSPLMLIG